MIVWGVNALNHDDSIAVVRDGELIEWTRPESGTLRSNDFVRLLDRGTPDRIAWYERPWVKKTRQAYAGQWDSVFDVDVVPRRWLNSFGFYVPPIDYHPHHKSHAAAGFLTSPFTRAAVLVLDAIGEWNSSSIWLGEGNSLRKLWSSSYPNSLGLFYSAFTKLLGFVPVKEEYKLQALAAQGDWKKFYPTVSAYIGEPFEFTRNLHRGVYDWPFEVDDSNRADIAAAVQKVFEEQAYWAVEHAFELAGTRDLVYMGGCAMNSQFNKILETRCRRLWSLPNPGDPSSSIGAALLTAGTRIEWKGSLPRHLEVRF